MHRAETVQVGRARVWWVRVRNLRVCGGGAGTFQTSIGAWRERAKSFNPCRIPPHVTSSSVLPQRILLRIHLFIISSHGIITFLTFLCERQALPM